MNDELREEYEFDYSTAKPNRFATRLVATRGNEMRILGLLRSGAGHEYTWQNGERVKYDTWLDYAVVVNGEHLEARIGFRVNPLAFGCARQKGVVWVEDRATAFVAADNYDSTGELLSQIKKPSSKKYFHVGEVLPSELAGLKIEHFKARVSGGKVNNTLAVVANIADHETMIKVALVRLSLAQESDSFETTEHEPGA